MGGIAQRRVFLDSNILYSRTLRDWLGLLYLRGEAPPFLVFWSEDVLADTIHHLRKKHPDWDGAKTSTIRDRIAATFEVGRVADYVVDGSYGGCDPDDAHVHAAAVECRADILLTSNVKHFSWGHDSDDSAPYEVMAPDDFIFLVDDSVPDLVCAVSHDQATYWFARKGEANPPEQLRTAGAPQFAERVRRHLQSL